jgi:hypothetical protein
VSGVARSPVRRGDTRSWVKHAEPGRWRSTSNHRFPTARVRPGPARQIFINESTDRATAALSSKFSCRYRRRRIGASFMSERGGKGKVQPRQRPDLVEAISRACDAIAKGNCRAAQAHRRYGHQAPPPTPKQTFSAPALTTPVTATPRVTIDHRPKSLCRIVNDNYVIRVTGSAIALSAGLPKDAAR